jgi:HEAT repeat protein
MGAVCIALLLALGQTGHTQGDRRMLRETILKKDPAAALLAREAGPSANPEIIELTKHQDAKVRRIALYCLDETGGADAARAMAAALKDDDPQVRGAALKGLIHRPDPVVYEALLRVYPGADKVVRQQIPLILGKMGGRANPADLRRVCGAEADAEAREGCLTALASMGDPPAQMEFTERLHASKGRERARFLEYCDYIHQPWLLKPLGPVLDDTSPMVRVGVDARPDLIDSLRACDLAVNLIASIGKVSFSFPVNRMTNYTAAQIAEVKRLVERA